MVSHRKKASSLLSVAKALIDKAAGAKKNSSVTSEIAALKETTKLVEKVVTDMTKEKSKIYVVQNNKLASAIADVQALVEAWDALEPQLKEDVEACSYEKANDSLENRAYYMKRHALKQKIESLLKTLKVSEKTCKNIAALVVHKEVNVDRETELKTVALPQVQIGEDRVVVDSGDAMDGHDKPYAWLLANGEKPAHEVVKQYVEMMNDDPLHTLTEASKRAKKEKNKAWMVSMTGVDKDSFTFKVLGSLKVDGLEETGCAPWGVVGPEGMFRTTCNQMPLPGVASFILSGVGAPTLFLLPVQCLLDTGFALKNLNSFLDNGDPVTFMQKHGVVIHMKKGDVVFCPTGWVAAPANLGLNGGGSCALMYIPVLHSKMLEGINGNVVASIKEFNMDFFKTKDSPMWAARKKAFLSVYGAPDS